MLWLGAAGATTWSRFAAIVCGLLLLGHAAGGQAARPAALQVLEDHPLGLEGPWQVRGRVQREPEPDARGSSFRMLVTKVRVDGSWQPWAGRVQVRVPEPAPDHWPRGLEIEAFLRLRRDRPPANPGRSASHSMLVAGLDARATIKSYRQLRVPEAPAGVSVRQLPGRARAGLRNAVARQFRRHDAVVRALLLGERDGLADALGSRMARAGLIHLLAISGLHVGLLTALAIGASRLLGLSPRTATAVGLAMLAALALLVVPRAPVRRAAVMAAAILAGKLLGRRVSALDAISAAVFALVLVEPATALDFGLHLSAAATLGILILVPGPGPPRSYVGTLARVSVAAQAAVAPLLALTTRQLPLAGLVLNLAAVPLMGLLLPLIVVAVGLELAGLSTVAAPLARFDETLIDLLLWLARIGAQANILVVQVPLMTWTRALAIWAALAGVRLLQPPAARIAAGGLLVVASAAAIRAPLPPPDPELIVIDVGQGDAVLLHEATSTILIDAGGYPGLDYDTGAHLVAPLLRHLGVRRLDAVAATHAHADHISGLAAILKQFDVRQAWLGAGPVQEPLLERFLAAAAARGTPTSSPRGRRPFGACTWTALSPPLPALLAGARKVENDASLAFGVACGRRRLLLTGDAGVAAELGWEVGWLRGALLKVGHHGSATSTSADLLERLQPRHAVISVGHRNPFGLPRTEVVERLRDRGIAVYRTDRDGALTVSLGARVRVHGERWRSGRGSGS